MVTTIIIVGVAAIAVALGIGFYFGKKASKTEVPTT